MENEIQINGENNIIRIEISKRTFNVITGMFAQYNLDFEDFHNKHGHPENY